MSFNDLLNASVTRKTKEVPIEVNGKTIVFTATEISYIERLHLASLSALGAEGFSSLIASSITDPDGNKMTVEQVKQLPEQYAEKFFIAATEVNSGEVKTEKN